MELTCEKKQLEEAVAAASRAISPRSPLPILSHLLLQTGSNSLSITATDLDVGLTLEIPSEIGAPGSITCPAKLFQEIVSRLPGGTVRIRIHQEGRLELTCGSSRFEMATLPAEEFPSLPDLKEAHSIVLRQADLKGLIKQVAIAAASSQDESRAIMTGISMTIEQDRLTLVATDGRRLACTRRTLSEDIPGGASVQVVLPSRAFLELARSLQDDGDLTVQFGSNQVFFLFNNCSLHSRILEGRFPDYTKVVPTSFQRSCRVGRDQFMDSLRRMLVVAQEKRSPHLIRLTFSDDTLELAANTPDLGSGEETLPVVFEGDPLVIGFNGKYLLDGLSVLSCQEVQFDLQEESKSAVLRPLGDDNYDYVVMPVKLRDAVEEYEPETVEV